MVSFFQRIIFLLKKIGIGKSLLGNRVMTATISLRKIKNEEQKRKTERKKKSIPILQGFDLVISLYNEPSHIPQFQQQQQLKPNHQNMEVRSSLKFSNFVHVLLLFFVDNLLGDCYQFVTHFIFFSFKFTTVLAMDSMIDSYVAPFESRYLWQRF